MGSRTKVRYLFRPSRECLERVYALADVKYLPQIKSTYSLDQHNCVHPGSLEGVAMSNSWGDSLNDLWDCGCNERLQYGEEAPPSLRHSPCKILFQGQPFVAAPSEWARLRFALQPNGSSTWQGNGRFRLNIFQHLVGIKTSVSPVSWRALLPWVKRWRKEWNFQGGWRWASESKPESTPQWSGHSVGSILLVSNSTRKGFSTFLTPFHFPFPLSIPLCC